MRDPKHPESNLKRSTSPTDPHQLSLTVQDGNPERHSIRYVSSQITPSSRGSSMFTTFVGVPNDKASKRAGPKQKRQQVIRACALCRRSRTKCDNNLPCVSCLDKGVKCTYVEGETSGSARADNVSNVTRLVASEVPVATFRAPDSSTNLRFGF